MSSHEWNIIWAVQGWLFVFVLWIDPKNVEYRRTFILSMIVCSLFFTWYAIYD